jgi:hypothetical protein
MNTAYTALHPLGAGSFHVATLVALQDGTQAVLRSPNPDLLAMGVDLDGLRRELVWHMRLASMGLPVVPVIEADLDTCQELDVLATVATGGDETEAIAIVNYISTVADMVDDPDMKDHLTFLLADAVHNGDVHWNQFGYVQERLVLLDI